jgi:hypothetical protein
MRVVYGAGAVAAMSIMAVGLVQPDWSSTADPEATDDAWLPSDDPGAVAGLPDKLEAGWVDPTAAPTSGGGTVRHVTRYVYLKPGQKPPPGATVIPASQAPGQGGRNHPSNPDATATPRSNNNGGGNNGGGNNGGGNNGGGNNGGGNNGGGNNGGGSAATPRPPQPPAATPRPPQPPAATPRPTPRPTPTARQSGRP